MSKEKETTAVMKIGRRAFLKHSALGISGLLVGCEWECPLAVPQTFDPYEKVLLGRTGLIFPAWALGPG